MNYRIEFEFVCGCCLKKQKRGGNFQTSVEMKKELYRILQSLADNEDIVFASIQQMKNGKTTHCFFIVNDEIRFVCLETKEEETISLNVKQAVEHYLNDYEVA